MLDSILMIINGIIQLIKSWISSDNLKKQSETDLQGRLDAIEEAKRLRDEADASNARDPSGVLRDDDGFKRTDD
jgi:hypothetical protein